MRFTQKTVDALDLTPRKTEAIIFDDDLPGFGLRLRRGGSRVWVYQFKIGARHRRLTLGSATAVPLAQARKIAAELHAKVRLGRDPAGEKAEGRTRAAETLAVVLQTYLAHKRASLKPGSYKGVERHLLRHCKPLHGLQLTKIDRRAVAGRIAAVAAKSGAVEANRVSSSLAAFFAWCLREGLVDTNPAAGGNRAPEQSRTRVLNDDELKAIWNATEGNDDYAAIVRLLIITGARANEIGGLRWSEIIDGRIVLLAARTKNAREHEIPLAPVARTLLDARARRADRDFVFGRRQDRPFTGWSICKDTLDARLSSAVRHWTHHDLRRSMATRMAENLDIEPHIIEAVLNHVSGHKHGVAGVYNRARYEQQKTTTLLRWADYVLAIVEGRQSKVIPLSATKRQV
jgi:integrase